MHPSLNVQIVDNPKRNIPTALNRAITAAQGEYIVRLDAHSVSPLGTPLVWPQLLWVAGLVMFLAIASLLLARALAALVTRDSLIGTQRELQI